MWNITESRDQIGVFFLVTHLFIPLGIFQRSNKPILVLSSHPIIIWTNVKGLLSSECVATSLYLKKDNWKTKTVINTIFCKLQENSLWQHLKSHHNFIDCRGLSPDRQWSGSKQGLNDFSRRILNIFSWNCFGSKILSRACHMQQ